MDVLVVIKALSNAVGLVHQLVVQVVGQDLDGDPLPVNLKPVKGMHRVFGHVGSLELNYNVASWQTGLLVLRDLDIVNAPAPLKVGLDIPLCEVVHLIFVYKAKDADFAPSLLVGIVHKLGLHFLHFIFLLLFLLVLGCLGNSVLLGLRCLDHDRLVQ